MSGQGHQFSGGFPNQTGGMRNNFGPLPMGGPMSGSIGGHMPNQMVPGMPAMMNQPYNQNVLNQSLSQNGHPMQQIQTNHALQQSPAQGPQPSPVAPSMGKTPPGSAQPALPAAPAPAKDFNTATLCRFGQETVQDIVSRMSDVFQTLKVIQPPNGTVQGANASNEKKAKVQEQLRTIRLLFKRVRLIFEKCNESCHLQGMEYTHIESLIPLKEDLDQNRVDNSEGFKAVMDENKELTEQVVVKNRQLKEVIDHLRRIVWEINTMLTMRRS